MSSRQREITTTGIDKSLRELLGKKDEPSFNFDLARMITEAYRDLEVQRATRAECVKMGRESRGVKAVIGPQEPAPNGNGPGVA